MTDVDRPPSSPGPIQATAADAPPGGPDATSPRRRRWPRFAILLAVVVAVWLVHVPVLRGLGGLLVCDEPIGQYQYVGLCGRADGPDGDRAYQAAVELYRQRPGCRILLIEAAPTRLVQSGVLESFAMLSRRELAARGVSPDAVVAASADGWDDWATARVLRTWLSAHPTANIVLLCGRLRSAYVRHALNAVLDPPQADRVRLHALFSRQCDESNWWKSRVGYKDFGMHWLRRVHAWCVGGGVPPVPPQSADDYERSFRATLSEAAR